MKKAKSRFERKLATKIFTDREDPQKLIVGNIEQLMADRELCGVVNFYGIGGIGKTSLLDHLHMKLLEKNTDDRTYASVRMQVDCIKYDLDAFNSENESLQELEAALMEQGYRFMLFEAALELCLPASQHLSMVERRKNPKTSSKLGNIALQIASFAAPIDPGAITSIISDIADLFSDVHGKYAKAFEPAREELRGWEKCPPTRDYLLSHLREYFARDLECNIKMRQKPLVVLLDSYEDMVNTYADGARNIDEWLIDLFETPGVLWVLAGREHLDLPDVENHLIGKLAFEDASRFLESAEVDAKYHEMIYELSGGIPLMLDLCVDIYHKREEEEVTPELFGATHDALVNRYAKHCMGEKDQQVMMMLSALERWSDAEARALGARLAGKLWNEVEFEHLYDEAMRHSIIVKTDDRRYITRVVQEVFAGMLKEDAPVARVVGNAMLECEGVRIDEEKGEVTANIFHGEEVNGGYLVDFTPVVKVARALRIRGIADETLVEVSHLICIKLIEFHNYLGGDRDGKMTMAAHELLDALKAAKGNDADKKYVAWYCMQLLSTLNSERTGEAAELMARLFDLSEPNAENFEVDVSLYLNGTRADNDALERLAELERIEQRYATVIASDPARQAMLHYLHAALFISDLSDIVDDQAFHDEFDKAQRHAEQARELWKRAGVEDGYSLSNDFNLARFYLMMEEREKHDELVWSVYKKGNKMLTPNNEFVADVREYLEHMLLERGEVSSALDLICSGDGIHILTNAELDMLNGMLRGDDDDVKLAAATRAWANVALAVQSVGMTDPLYFDKANRLLWVVGEVLVDNLCYDEAKQLFTRMRDIYEAIPNLDLMAYGGYAQCLDRLCYLTLITSFGTYEPRADGIIETDIRIDRESSDAIREVIALFERAQAIAEHAGMDTREWFRTPQELVDKIRECVQ